MVYFVLLISFFVLCIFFFFGGRFATGSLSSARCTRHPLSPRSSAEIPNLLRGADATRDSMVLVEELSMIAIRLGGSEMVDQVHVCACEYVVNDRFLSWRKNVARKCGVSVNRRV